MNRLARILAVLVFGGSLLLAQIPNPLNLPDPLGLSKDPAPSASRAPRKGGRAERKPAREAHRNQGRQKGQEAHQKRNRGGHKKGHDRH